MIKLLIGGSPCTHWSIAQKNNRETEPEGLGWELFKNYLIAKEKFKPDFFLYENNKSASQAIKDQIAEEFGVGVDPNVRFTYINSALVSAQNRQRFYVTNFGDIEQPEDRNILLKDILESGQPVNSTTEGKAGAIRATCYKDTIRNLVANDCDRRTCVAEPIRVCEIENGGQGYRIYSTEGKSVAQTAKSGGLGAYTGLYAIPVNTTDDGNKARTLMAGYYKYGTATLLTNEGFKGGTTAVAEPVCPFVESKFDTIVEKYGYLPELFNPYNKAEIIDKSPTLTTCCGSQTSSASTFIVDPVVYAIICECNDIGIPTKAISLADGKIHTVYKVENGLITIKEKEYPIKLKDGYYIIRKLTVKECARLQTMPDDYCKAVSDSQAYKALGNGWTAEVIIHLLNHALKDIPRDEEIVVLSLYDGIATGRYCLDKMGFTNVRYYAYEIDKYPIMVAMDNYPDIIQMGDAFDIRHPELPTKISEYSK